ncbi:MAG: O-antigen ligase family protein [Ruminococcaceae bacterium]|nr:O-antigen ligase family protein [Oscillospiraceae bacterium]
MPRRVRSRATASRAAYLYACALLTVLYLFLPFGGYERMMEGKYFCFLALSLGAVAVLSVLAPLDKPRMTPMRWCAAAYLGFSALSALCSPYGARTLLGGPRRDGLLTLAIYAALFFLLSRWLRADGRLVAFTAGAAALCCLLALWQLAGGNPLRLYPDGLNYYAGDVEHTGFYAGVSGNVDFTAFLLALAACVVLAAAVRRRALTLLPAPALALFVLWRLDVSAAWVGLAAAAVWGLALLFPRHRRAALLASAALTLALLALLWRYDGDRTLLAQASRVLHGEWDSSFGSGRVAIWRDCIPLVRERLLLGGGPDTLWLRGVEPLRWLHHGNVVPADITAAHNEYLNILVNQGALALAAYLGLLLCALARCFRRAEEARFAICGTALLCYGAMAMFSISTCITAPYVWLLLAIVQGDENDC